MTTTTEARAAFQERRNYGLKRRHTERLSRNGWLPVDEFIAAYEAARDPSGRYGSVGLKPTATLITSLED